jgi:hypothetical protein
LLLLRRQLSALLSSWALPLFLVDPASFSWGALMPSHVSSSMAWNEIIKRWHHCQSTTMFKQVTYTPGQYFATSPVTSMPLRVHQLAAQVVQNGSVRTKVPCESRSHTSLTGAVRCRP